MVPDDVDDFGHKKSTRQIGLWIDEAILGKWNTFCGSNGIKRTDLIKLAVNEYILRNSTNSFGKLEELEKKLENYAEKVNIMFARIDGTKGKAREEGWERALNYFDVAFKQVPINLQSEDWLQGLSFRLSMLFEIGQYKEIVKEVQRLGLKIANPEHWFAFHYLAKAHVELNEMHQAHGILDKLLAASTSNDAYTKPLLLITKGEAFQKQGKYPEAAEQFNLAFQRDPNNSQAHLKFAEFLHLRYRTGRYERDPAAENYYKDAERFYLKALELSPASSEAHGEYANYLWMRDEKEKVHLIPKEVKATTEEHYHKAIELDPNNTTAMTDYTFFLFWCKKEYGPIPAIYEKILTLEPKKLGHYLNYTGVLRMIDEHQGTTLYREKIENLYEIARVVDPSSEGPYVLSAEYHLYDLKDHEKAAQQYLKALEVNPLHPWPYLMYGDFLVIRRKDPVQAEQWYRRGLSQANPEDTNQCFFYLRIASVAFLQGLTAGAMNALNLAYSTNQKDPWHADELLCCHFLKFLHSPVKAERAKALEAIKHLVSKGGRFNRWSGLELLVYNAPAHAKLAIKSGHVNSRFARALVEVLAHGQDAKILDKFPEWKSL